MLKLVTFFGNAQLETYRRFVSLVMNKYTGPRETQLWSAHTSKGVSEDNSNLRGFHSIAEAGCKYRYPQDKNIAEQVESHS